MKFKYDRAQGELAIEAETVEEAVQLGLITQRLWDHNVKSSLADGRRLVVAVKRIPAEAKGDQP